MKIAIIDHIGNPGGGSRMLHSLLPALKRLSPDFRITFFGNPIQLTRENLFEELKDIGIEVVNLKSLKLKNLELFKSHTVGRIIHAIQERYFKKSQFLPFWLSGDVSTEICVRIKDYDLAYFPWPFLLDFPKINCPSVGTFHDFNYKYYFSGSLTFNKKQQEQLEREMPIWLKHCVPVVSSNFIESELIKFYPNVSTEPVVVRLPALGGNSRMDDASAQSSIRELGITGDYLLCPTNMTSHKNLGPLIVAIEHLRSKGKKIKLILTGPGTERIRGQAQTFGLLKTDEDPDVFGLGYVSNVQINSLIQCAKVVINSSLYEAGNGSGLDAWGLGTPVAMSNIPAFVEHVETLGVRAEIFNPHCPEDIAEKIATILDNPLISRKMIDESRSAMLSATWEHTAIEYMNVFRRVITESGFKK
jgi:glycosyltransferase involved in cell wall biosynthesis